MSSIWAAVNELVELSSDDVLWSNPSSKYITRAWKVCSGFAAGFLSVSTAKFYIENK